MCRWGWRARSGATSPPGPGLRQGSGAVMRLRRLLPLGLAAVGLGLFVYADLSGARSVRMVSVAVVLVAVVLAVWQASSWRERIRAQRGSRPPRPTASHTSRRRSRDISLPSSWAHAYAIH